MVINNNDIKLIIYDFDGVMTDNKAFIDQHGNEMVKVNRSDGLGVGEITKMGIKQLIISTEKNKVVKSRALKLKIECFHGVDDKKTILEEYCEINKIQLEKVIFVGNDINDEEAMKIVGLPFCPSDANQRIKDISSFVFKSKGGDGVVRELLDIIIKGK
jgi:YrbI family 3-deoxy-D-manno-octulosonate 8-phosphate phosphatase